MLPVVTDCRDAAAAVSVSGAVHFLLGMVVDFCCRQSSKLNLAPVVAAVAATDGGKAAAAEHSPNLSPQ